MAPRSTIRNWGPLLAFIRDWIFVASLSIWLPLLIISLIDGTASEVAALALPTSALCAYAIALSIAFLDDVPVSAWARSNKRTLVVFSRVLPLVRTPLIIVLGVIIAISVFADMSPTVADIVSQEQIFNYSLLLAGTAILLSAFVVLNSVGKKKRK